ncbi:520_t:CDS:2, partial [Entrophospora sp. SA101]
DADWKVLGAKLRKDVVKVKNALPKAKEIVVDKDSKVYQDLQEEKLACENVNFVQKLKKKAGLQLVDVLQIHN